MAFGILYDYLMGQSLDAGEYFGAHKTDDGAIFRLYAPMASDVSVIGEWNNWDVTKDKMKRIDDAGVWELEIKGVPNYAKYKFHFKNARGRYVDKADPFAFFSDLRPESCSRVFDMRGFIWHDEKWLASRTRNFDKPMNIYEMHLGSWMGKQEGGRYLSYEEIADRLIPYIQDMGYTHVEFMPLCQYPFEGSWGYQATGFYSADSRYGNPMQLMSLVDRLHQAGIGVIIDFAPVHFANDSYALKDYDGTCVYEYSDPKRKVSPWGSRQFDLGKDPVRSFLMGAMNFFLTHYHFDGIRVDAVSNMIFWEGNKAIGMNDGGIEFLKRANALLHLRHPSIMMIAEDSSDFPRVTKDTTDGGLGFDYKWDLGWMNDTLKYYSKDPIYKKWEHNKLTFSMAYFYSERFLLPLSHDEVVHGKGTILNKMHGDYETKFALVRNLYTYLFAHPGKKLTFMGDEFASYDEWNENRGLPWDLLHYPSHDSIKRLMRDLCQIYKFEPAMWEKDYDPKGYRWTMVDNADQSIFAFERGNLLFVFNMTPNFYDPVAIPCMHLATYEEIFNSDKDVYGGKNQYNGLPLKAEPGSFEGTPGHINVKLASYGAMIFKRQEPQEKKTK